MVRCRVINERNNRIINKHFIIEIKLVLEYNLRSITNG